MFPRNWTCMNRNSRKNQFDPGNNCYWISNLFIEGRMQDIKVLQMSARIKKSHSGIGSFNVAITRIENFMNTLIFL